MRRPSVLSHISLNVFEVSVLSGDFTIKTLICCGKYMIGYLRSQNANWLWSFVNEDHRIMRHQAGRLLVFRRNLRTAVDSKPNGRKLRCLPKNGWVLNLDPWPNHKLVDRVEVREIGIMLRHRGS